MHLPRMEKWVPTIWINVKLLSRKSMQICLSFNPTYAKMENINQILYVLMSHILLQQIWTVGHCFWFPIEYKYTNGINRITFPLYKYKKRRFTIKYSIQMIHTFIYLVSK